MDRVAIAVLMAIMPMTVVSQEYTALPDYLEYVGTCCRWEQSGSDGSYRIMIFRSGDEHITSRVYVEWLAAATENGPDKVLAWKGIDELNDGTVNVADPVLPALGLNPIIVFEATNAYSFEETRFKVQLGQPGTYRVVP